MANQSSMKWVKVTGTTFYTLPESALPQPVFSGTYLRDQEIPAQAYFGLVEPEPENAYDPDAVQVSICLADGTYAQIGHLPRTEPDRKSIKAPKKVLVFMWSGVEDIAFLADSGQFEEALSGMDEDQRNAMYEEICNQVDWDEVESAGIAAGNDVLERCLTEAIDRKCG